MRLAFCECVRATCAVLCCAVCYVCCAVFTLAHHAHGMTAAGSTARHHVQACVHPVPKHAPTCCHFQSESDPPVAVVGRWPLRRSSVISVTSHRIRTSHVSTHTKYTHTTTTAAILQLSGLLAKSLQSCRGVGGPCNRRHCEPKCKCSLSPPPCLCKQNTQALSCLKAIDGQVGWQLARRWLGSRRATPC